MLSKDWFYIKDKRFYYSVLWISLVIDAFGDHFCDYYTNYNWCFLCWIL